MDGKPEKPNESDCCGTGCNPCVFDVYEEQLKKWEMKQYSESSCAALNESKFLPFLVNDIETLTTNIKVFQFQSVKLINGNKDDTLISNAEEGVDYDILIDNLGLRAGHYLILKGEYEGCDGKSDVVTVHKISRSYTPLLGDCLKGSFKVIAAIYPDGKMSKFLNKLNVNDIVFWRGPYKEFTYSTNSYQTIIMIGGGTGVLPLYNIAKEIVENDVEETLVKFVASFKNVNSFILRSELNTLQGYWNFKLKIIITSQENSNYTLKYNEDVVFSKCNQDVIFQELSACKKNKCLIVICGPPGFSQFVHDTVMEYGFSKDNIYVYK